MESNNKRKGFASMSPEMRREIARKGGLATSANSAHMAEIGRKGGEASGRNRRTTSTSESSVES